MQKQEYIEFITDIKSSIIRSRYKAASLANREMLLLYYYTGFKLSDKIKKSNWGTGVIRNISDDLQKELPGLRGFSYRNLQNMKQFFEEYELLQNILLPAQYLNFIIVQSSTAQFADNEFMQLITAQTENEDNAQCVKNFVENVFLKIGFTHHITLINKCKVNPERIFYFQKIIENQWSITILEHHINSRLYQLQGQMINNFNNTLPEKLHKHATDAFKSEYLLDYINLDEEDDERVLENEIVRNIKKFIMSLGNDFSFIGNQYRVIVGEEEFFIDLLFYHLKLHCYVVIELKADKFKPEHLGQLGFYMTAVDRQMKAKEDAVTIGLLLCKSKDKVVAEYALGDKSQPMGIAEYKLLESLPVPLQTQLPSIEEIERELQGFDGGDV